MIGHSFQIPMQYLYPINSTTNNKNSDTKNSNSDICAVCLDVPGTTNVSITQCGHKFCTSCLLSSLNTRNTCPTCRAEIEPVRQPCIEPLPVSVASELIRTEEHAIQMNRRLQIINSFSGTNGRSAMILSLCREVAFATAHSIARWQKLSDKTYHKSWDEFDSSDDSESGSGSEDESE